MENSIGPVHDFHKVIPDQWQTLRLSTPIIKPCSIILTLNVVITIGVDDNISCESFA